MHGQHHFRHALVSRVCVYNNMHYVQCGVCAYVHVTTCYLLSLAVYTHTFESLKLFCNSSVETEVSDQLCILIGVTQCQVLQVDIISYMYMHNIIKKRCLVSHPGSPKFQYYTQNIEKLEGKSLPLLNVHSKKNSEFLNFLTSEATYPLSRTRSLFATTVSSPTVHAHYS